MLPDVYAVFFAGNAEPRPEEELRAQPRGETPVIHEEVLPTIPENPALGSERTYYNQKDLSSAPRTRSWRVARTERNRNPVSIYKRGEDAWLSITGVKGSFKVSIYSEGMWDDNEDQWKYQLQQTDGKLYENGKLVGEKDLNRTQK